MHYAKLVPDKKHMSMKTFNGCLMGSIIILLCNCQSWGRTCILIFDDCHGVVFIVHRMLVIKFY